MTKARDLSNLISTGVPNSLITLDANEIPNIDASKITSGSIATARLGNIDLTNLSATNLTSGTIPDARVSASAVSQHATSFDDNKLVNDISTLALRQASNENKGAYNTNSMYVDVFQDDTGIGTETNTDRNISEYVSSITSTSDATVMDVVNADALNTGDMASQVAIGVRGDTKIVSQGDGGISVNADHPFSTGKSFQTNSWGDSSADSGFWIKDHTGGSNQNGWANFGTGAFTIEFFVKLLSTGWGSGHKYIIDWAESENNYRLSMAGDGSSRSATFNGTLTNFGYMSTGFIWSDLGATDWGHVAIVRDSSGNMAQFVKGIRRAVSSSANTQNLNYSTSDYLAFATRHASSNGASGYLRFANVRISKSAQYDPTQSTCTVPTSELSTTSTGTSATGNFISNVITAPSSTSKMGAIITYQDQAGTNALNTDIVLQLSADNGSNFTTATMTAMPDFASGIKMAKVNDLSVTAGTQLKYKISFANQSLGSKEARIRGVSLQY